MSKIIVHASGWCEANPEKIMFQLISDLDAPKYITGSEWLKLPEKGLPPARDDYILENVGMAFHSAFDGDYSHLYVHAQEEV